MILRCLTLGGALVLVGCAEWPPAAGKSEPQVVRYSAEDDQVKIEELRVRGQLKRTVVSPKAEGTPSYEVLPPTDGQDPSRNRDAAGQRVWTVLTF